MTARKSVIAQINKMLKRGETDNPAINALFIKLVCIEPAVWTPIYQLFLTKKDPRSGAPESVVEYPLDRGGK